MIEKELIKKLIYTNPIALLAIKDQESIDFINSFLPYSTGFEIECNRLKEYNFKNWKAIPDIMNYNLHDENEQRFRIPNGLSGFICLFNICNELHRNCSLNEESGIHYHTDCTDIFDAINNQKWIDENNDWIIDRLKLWETAKVYNEYAKVSQSRAWVRLADEHKTIEIRIGEMSFDYSVIVNRIIDSNNIVKKIKDQFQLQARKVEYQSPNIKQILNYLKVTNTSQEYKNFELLKQELETKRKELEQQPTINPNIDMKEVIKSRIKKFI